MVANSFLCAIGGKAIVILIALFLATGIGGIAAEIYFRTGKVFSNSAVSDAAALFNKRNETCTIVEFQEELKCCGFLVNDQLKYYANCSSEDEEFQANCSEALNAAFWPLWLAVALSAANILFAVIVCFIERRLFCCSTEPNAQLSRPLSDTSDMIELDVMDHIV